MRLEEWTAFGSLAMSVMFSLLLPSFYNFLVGPNGEGPERVVTPGSLLIQAVSISAAPSLILAAVAFLLSKAQGSKIGGLTLIATGLVMVIGMAVALTILTKIDDKLIVEGMIFVPYAFIAAGAGIAAMGGYLLLRLKTRRKESRDILEP